jgi:hypothetical protein
VTGLLRPTPRPGRGEALAIAGGLGGVRCPGVSLRRGRHTPGLSLAAARCRIYGPRLLLRDDLGPSCRAARRRDGGKSAILSATPFPGCSSTRWRRRSPGPRWRSGGRSWQDRANGDLRVRYVATERFSGVVSSAGPALLRQGHQAGGDAPPRPPQEIEQAYHRLMASDPANLPRAADLRPLLMPPSATAHQAPRTGRACQPGARACATARDCPESNIRGRSRMAAPPPSQAARNQSGPRCR